MSELATIARPYAKAAFELAVEKGTVESWNDMLFFAGQVASNEQAAAALADCLLLLKKQICLSRSVQSSSTNKVRT